MKTNYRWSAGALGAIHEAAEHFLITLLCIVCIALMKTNYRWSAGALGAIHEAAEHFLITLLENANLCAIHAKHVTVSVNNV